MNNLKSLLLLLGAVIFGVGHVKLGISQELVLPVGIQDEMPTYALPNENGYSVSGGYLSSYKGSFHAGVDLANGSPGGEIRAVADGVVVGTRNSATSSWGNAVLIKHETFPAGTIYSQYAHMLDGSVLVGLHCVEGSKNGEVCSTDSDCAGGTCKGDVVYAGQPIGAVGSTGTSEGFHLHFEIKQVGTFDYGYFNVHNEVNDFYQARRCSNNLSLKCHVDADCVSPGTCIVKASSDDYVDPLEYIVTNGNINLTSKFSFNDQLEVVNGPVNIRATANGTLIGKKATGTKGTVTSGPTYASGHWWWKVNFDQDSEGWVVEEFLNKSTSSPIVLEDFENYPLGDFVDDAWSHSPLDIPNNTITNDQYVDGNKSLSKTTLPASATEILNIETTPDGEIATLSWWEYVTYLDLYNNWLNNPMSWTGVVTVGQGHLNYVHFCIHADGLGLYVSETVVGGGNCTEDKTIGRYEFGKWHHITAQFDTANNVFRARVDDDVWSEWKTVIGAMGGVSSFVWLPLVPNLYLDRIELN